MNDNKLLIITNDVYNKTKVAYVISKTKTGYICSNYDFPADVFYISDETFDNNTCKSIEEFNAIIDRSIKLAHDKILEPVDIHGKLMPPYIYVHKYSTIKRQLRGIMTIFNRIAHDSGDKDTKYIKRLIEQYKNLIIAKKRKEKRLAKYKVDNTIDISDYPYELESYYLLKENKRVVNEMWNKAISSEEGCIL